jgi:hypothetical protein
MEYGLGSYMGDNAEGLSSMGNLAGGVVESTGSAVGTIAGGALKGAAAGAAFGPIGAAVGGALGLAGGLFKNKKNKEAEALQQQQQNQQVLQMKQQALLSAPQAQGGIWNNPLQGQMSLGGFLTPQLLAKSGIQVKACKGLKVNHNLGGMIASDKLAKGGFVNPLATQYDGIVNYSSGGKHEQNPLGGIPIGTSATGKQNTVEQGETSFKFKEGKYIFSNRLYL